MRDALPEQWSADGAFGVRVELAVLNLLLEACRKSGRNETGGILVGRYSDDRRLATITSASVSTTDSRAGRTWLVRGIQGLHSWLESLWKGDSGYYVGEWHFHPFAPPVPSREDANQMRRIATNQSYQCVAPILLIFGGDPRGSWVVWMEVHTREGSRHLLTPTSGEG